MVSSWCQLASISFSHKIESATAYLISPCISRQIENNFGTTRNKRHTHTQMAPQMHLEKGVNGKHIDFNKFREKLNIKKGKILGNLSFIFVYIICIDPCEVCNH